jgi:hypothetical protein
MLIEFITTSVTEFAYWPQDGSAYAGSPFQWSVVLDITPQTTSAPDTPTPYYYTGTDVVVGDWMSNAVGGMAWIIRSITSADASDLTCVIEDVDLYNTYADPSGNGDGAPANESAGFIFSLDESGQPILSPLIDQKLTDQFQTDLMGRFAATMPPVTTALKGFTQGTTIDNETVTLTLQNGSLEWVPASALTASIAAQQATLATLVANLQGFVFPQLTPALTWTINHNLGRFPNVDLIDTSGQLVEAEVDYPSNEQVIVKFAIATAGTAYLN